MDVYVLEKLRLHVNNLNFTDWEAMLQDLIEPVNGEVEIAVVGKYIQLRDAYKSIYEALTHGGIANSVRVKVRRIESETLDGPAAASLLDGVQGVLVPGGFGTRGVNGKMAAVRYARERGIPFFGICLGMQCAVMEFARNVCNLAGANSTEFDEKTPHPVIDLMAEQKQVSGLGGTMRLGAKPCRLTEASLAARIYGAQEISERHRHRYEFNNVYRERFEQAGMALAGLSPDGGLVELIELPSHPWFVACQFHPEFQSTPLKPHPLFADFVRAACGKRA